jgi:hypothetical protein
MLITKPAKRRPYFPKPHMLFFVLIVTALDGSPDENI